MKKNNIRITAIRQILQITLLLLTMSILGQDYLCKTVRVKHEIWENQTQADSIIFVRSELWSEYNDNIVNNRKEIPDTIFIRANIMLPIDMITDQSTFQDTSFFLKTTLSLKYSIYDDCIDVINPKLSKEFLVDLRKITFKEIRDGMNKDDILKINLTPFPLSEIQKENDIGLMHTDRYDNYLCQIVVKSYLGFSLDKFICESEYIFPICAPFITNYIINEW